jgi:hypothetical protein
MFTVSIFSLIILVYILLHSFCKFCFNTILLFVHVVFKWPILSRFFKKIVVFLGSVYNTYSSYYKNLCIHILTRVVSWIPSSTDVYFAPLCNTVFKPSARGYNWATLFLGDINTGTWPSRFGESQMRQ